jgi:hypothetical protein
MKKILSVFMSMALLFWLVALASGGLNDRFSPIELTDIPNATSGTDIVTKTATQTLTNKTLTSPTVTGGTYSSPAITGGTFTSSTGSSMTLTTPTVTGGTFTSATISGSTTLGGTLTGGTLATATITSPTVTGIDTTYNVSSHEYTTNADWVMSATEAKSFLLTVTSASSTTNIIAPNVSGRLYVVRNDTSPGGNCTIKKSGGTGIAIACGKTATVIHNGSDYIRVTADQTH